MWVLFCGPFLSFFWRDWRELQGPFSGHLPLKTKGDKTEDKMGRYYEPHILSPGLNYLLHDAF